MSDYGTMRPLDQLPIGLFDSAWAADRHDHAPPSARRLPVPRRHRPRALRGQSQKTVVRYSLQAAAKLIDQRIKLLVIATCNGHRRRASALRETWPDMPSSA